MAAGAVIEVKDKLLLPLGFEVGLAEVRKIS